MININLDTSDGLNNGVMGTIMDIKTNYNNPDNIMETIFVKFDNESVG